MARVFAAAAILFLTACAAASNLKEELSYAASHPGALVFTVEDRGMVPTIRPGDDVLAAPVLNGHGLDRGDIVLFRLPDESGDAVGRIVALAGDKLAVAGGWLYLNNRKAGAPYNHWAANYDLSVDNYRIRSRYPDERSWDLIPKRFSTFPRRQLWKSADRVPSGCYVVFGDNRNASTDSHTQGFIRRNAILGRVDESLRYF